ncbi:MAG TPA: hypothetical protein VGE10_15280 [Zeimonas sp.]
MSTLLRPFFATIATVAVLLPMSATAAEEDDTPREARAATLQAAPSPTTQLWADGSVLDERELSQQRGGADLHLNENNASAIVTDNVATNLTTGNNSINGDSFSGMSGVPMVVQNSGNNVIIQNSTILNLQMQ